MVAVSVLLATHNRADLLSRAVTSIQRQEFQDYEIIIIDDCSSDETAAVAMALQSSDERIRYFCHSRNRGVAAARNTALRMSRGRFIAMFDDDDEWICPQKLVKQVRVLEEDQEIGVVCTSVRLVGAAGHSRDHIVSLPNNLVKALLRGNGLIYNPTVMVRRRVFDDVGGFDERIRSGVDSDFFRRYVVEAKGRVKCLQDVTTAVYVNHASRMTSDRSFGAEINRLKSHVLVLRKHWRTFLLHPSALVARLLKMNTVVVRLATRLFGASALRKKYGKVEAE